MTGEVIGGRRLDSRTLFDGTASYYARYRPPYPAEAIRALVDRFGLNPRTYVMDLGCGTGQVALPLSAHGSPVIAVDPNPDMLAEGIRTQNLGYFGDIRWVLGDDTGLSAARFPGVRLCVMGASFHWTDRAALLSVLDGMLDRTGGVALLSGSASIWSKNATVLGPWVDVAREVVQEFLGPQRRAGSSTYSHPIQGHEEVLAESAFSRIRRTQFTTTRVLSVDDVIGLQLSTSYASPALLGERLPAFRDEFTVRLLAVEPGGRFATEERTELITASRPGRAGLGA
jgi:SAM-dependent methyltransferase